MDTQQYAVGVANGLVYHHAPHSAFLEHHPRPFPLSSQQMSWHTPQTSPPNSAASTSSSLYSAMSHVDDRVDYEAAQAFVPRSGYPAPQHSPSLPSDASPFESSQIESSIGPSRIFTRRRARGAAQGLDQAQGSPYDRRPHSLAFVSRPHTPGGPLPGTPFDIGSGAFVHSGAAMTAYGAFMPTHSRSTSGSGSSGSSHLRSASPAASISSAITSVSSASVRRSRVQPPLPSPQLADHSNEQENENLASSKGPRQKHRKTRLEHADRRRICEYSRQFPSLKQEEIAREFKVERSTVSKILKDRERWLKPDNEKPTSSRTRPAKFGELETALENWLQSCKRDRILLTDALIRETAKKEGLKLGIDETRFKASSGWVENFKARHGIKKGIYNGRGESNHDENVDMSAASGGARASAPAAHAEVIDLASDEESAHQLAYSPEAPHAWSASAPAAAVYEHAAPPEPAPMPGPSAVQVSEGGGGPHGAQEYLVTPAVQFNEEEDLPSLAEAEIMVEQLLTFFRTEEHQPLITPEQEETLIEVQRMLFSRSTGMRGAEPARA